MARKQAMTGSWVSLPVSADIEATCGIQCVTRMWEPWIAERFFSMSDLGREIIV